MDKEKYFLNKYCKLVLYDNNFVLYGFVDDVTDFGIFFRTDQKTSFIGFPNIKELVPTGNGD